MQEKEINPWLFFLTVSLATLMVGIDFLAIGVAIGPMAAYFHIGISTVQWFMTAFAIGNASCLIIAGRFIDKFGKRSIFLSGLVLFVVSSLVIACVDNVWVVIISRLLQGAAGGALSTSATAILLSRYSQKERAIWISRLVGVTGLGMVIGPSFGGFLLTHFGWQSIFLINLPVGIFCFYLATRYVRKTVVRNHEPLSLFNMILLTLGIMCLAVGLTHLGNRQQQMTVLITLVAAFVFFAVFYLLERRAINPIISRQVLKCCNMLPGMWVAFCAYFTALSWLFLWGIYFHRVLRLSAFIAGVYFLPFGVMIVVGGFVIPKLVHYIQAKQLIIIGCACSMLGFFFLSTLSLHPNIMVLLLLFAFVGFGFSLVNATSMPVAMKSIPVDKVGIGSGKAMMARWLGAAFGVALSSILFLSFARNHFSLILKQHHVILTHALAGILQLVVSGKEPALMLVGHFQSVSPIESVSWLRHADYFSLGATMIILALVSLCALLSAIFLIKKD